MDKRFHLASLRIAACYRGIKTRRTMTNLLRMRKHAVWLIQMFVRRRIKKMRLRKEQEAAALTIQRFCKGYTVNKRYAKQLGDISIMNTLKVFRDMKEQFGVTLSNLLRFHWKVYLRVKKKKAAKKKKGKKGKGKTSRNVVGSSKSMSMTMQPPPR